MILSCNGGYVFRSGYLGTVEYTIINITPRSTLDRSECTSYGSIYELNRYVWKLFVLDMSI